MRPIKIESPMKGVVHLVYKTQDDLARAFVRIEEHYESPEFAGKIFTLGQFRKWYSETYGAWTYYEDWCGFNVPRRAFKAFVDGMFDPLTKREQAILDLVRYRQDDYYVIGTYEGGDEWVYKHELAHAMFHLSPEYRDDVCKLIESFGDSVVPLANVLRKQGYGENVIMDECNAYMTTSEDWLKEQGVPYPADLAIALKELKEKYENALKG